MKTLEERFFEKLEGRVATIECLEWTSSKDGRGYGKLWAAGKFYAAHRVAWLVEHGEWPAGVVMHACDNPLCVNVRHLSVGTPADNVRDAVLKGRLNHKGEGNPQSKLTQTQVTEIRHACAAGVTKKALARQYAVSPTAISKVVSRRKWAHVE